MRVLVTGANGFLGRYIVAAASDASHHVIAASREGDPVPGAGAILRTGDLARNISALDLSDVDALIHCAARVHVLRREDSEAAEAEFFRVNAELPVKLARMARDAGVNHFIQISSVAALRRVSPPGQILTDQSEPAPATPYGRSKLAADKALESLADGGFTVTSLRPPTLYGPGVGAWFAMLDRAARAGMPIPIGAFENRRSFAYVANVADAAVASLELNRSGSFIVTDSLPISTAALYRRLLALHGHGDRVWSWPKRVVRAATRLALSTRAESLLGDAAFDGARFAREFEWKPRASMDEALEKTVRESRAAWRTGDR